MKYCGQDSLVDYLNFSTSPQAPMKAVTCPFASQEGAGMGLPVFALFVFGGVGLALTIRVQHPAPIIVAAMLSAGVVTLSLPSSGAKVFTLVLFFAISALGLYLYSRAQSSL